MRRISTWRDWLAEELPADVLEVLAMEAVFWPWAVRAHR